MNAKRNKKKTNIRNPPKNKPNSTAKSYKAITKDCLYGRVSALSSHRADILTPVQDMKRRRTKTSAAAPSQSKMMLQIVTASTEFEPRRF